MAVLERVQYRDGAPPGGARAAAWLILAGFLYASCTVYSWSKPGAVQWGASLVGWALAVWTAVLVIPLRRRPTAP